MNETIIDTDIISYYLRGHDSVIKNVLKYLNKYSTLNISSITYFEILSGLEYKKATKKIKEFKKFASKCKIFNLDIDTIEVSR